MAYRLFLQPTNLSISEPVSFDWALYDLKGQKSASGLDADLDMLSQTLMQSGAESVKAVLLWPANAVFSTSITLPGKSARYLQQALAFAVEDKVACDIESLHLATGKPYKNSVQVHCIESAGFNRIYDQLLDAEPEILLSSAYIDAELLPLDDQDLVISIQGDWATLATQTDLIRLHTQNLPHYLDSYFLRPSEQSESSCRVKVYEHNANDADHKILIAEIEQYPGVEIDVEPLSISTLELLAESYYEYGPAEIDLLQGAYRIQRDNAGQFKQWAWVAAIAAVAFFIQIGVFVGKGIHYSDQADAIGNMAIEQYKQVVPNSRNVTVARLARVIKGKLRESEGQGGDAGFLALLGEAGYQYQQRKGRTNLSFSSINYSAQRGELVVELTAKTFEEMDQLKNAIVSAGLEAKISSAVQEGELFRGRLSVSEG